jgi:uncharacterized protein YegP (UPF0339 family)
VRVIGVSEQSEGESQVAKFEIYADTAGKYRWRLKADNGTKIASSGENFDSKANAKRAAETVKATAGSATVEDV